MLELLFIECIWIKFAARLITIYLKVIYDMAENMTECK